MSTKATIAFEVDELSSILKPALESLNKNATLKWNHAENTVVCNPELYRQILEDLLSKAKEVRVTTESKDFRLMSA